MKNNIIQYDYHLNYKLSTVNGNNNSMTMNDMKNRFYAECDDKNFKLNEYLVNDIKKGSPSVQFFFLNIILPCKNVYMKEHNINNVVYVFQNELVCEFAKNMYPTRAAVLENLCERKDFDFETINEKLYKSKISTDPYKHPSIIITSKSKLKTLSNIDLKNIDAICWCMDYINIKNIDNKFEEKTIITFTNNLK